MDVVKYYTYYDEAVLQKAVTRLDSRSKNWLEWMTDLKPGTCVTCFSRHGKIYPAEKALDIAPPVHPNCRCCLDWLTAFLAGTVTQAGVNGVDFYVFMNGHLPKNYLTQDEARKQGWVSWKGNLRLILPNAVIGGAVYDNDDEKLPGKLGRIWYEADFDYNDGYRNLKRIVFSNDGLMFVTYDHYQTFSEVYWMGDFYELYT